MKSVKWSSEATELGISFLHFLHLCKIIHHLFFLLSIPMGSITHKHFESLSPGKSLSRCFENRQKGQWFLALPSRCLRTLLLQFSQVKDSLIMINHILLEFIENYSYYWENHRDQPHTKDYRFFTPTNSF